MNLQAFNPNPDTTKQLEEQVYQVLTIWEKTRIAPVWRKPPTE